MIKMYCMKQNLIKGVISPFCGTAKFLRNVWRAGTRAFYLVKIVVGPGRARRQRRAEG